MTYVADEDGVTVSEECMHYCTPVHVAECDAPLCRCACHQDAADELARDIAERAKELDDRPDDKLAVIANELEHERRGNLRDLTAERFGRSA